MLYYYVIKYTLTISMTSLMGRKYYILDLVLNINIVCEHELCPVKLAQIFPSLSLKIIFFWNWLSLDDWIEVMLSLTIYKGVELPSTTLQYFILGLSFQTGMTQWRHYCSYLIFVVVKFWSLFFKELEDEVSLALGCGL